jgi:pimeloyl-ACP methyl ester carboxylesterase
VVEPFRIDVPQGVLDDLAVRLERARRPDAPVLAGGEDPARLERIGRLFERWRHGYDWRAEEARMNAYEQVLVDVDGVRLHVLRAGSRGAPPLLLINGWPSTFAEYLPALPRLHDFDVALVSRPGYGFSDHGLDRPGDDEDAATLVRSALTDGLGWARFAAHGDDFGGSIVSRMALQRPEAVAAMHTCEWLEELAAPDQTAAERAYVEGVQRWREDERGYGHVQANRPQTLGLALDDSPFGLLAWIADKWLSWSDPACALDDDLILTTATIYWVTRTIAPSMRAYAVDAPPPQARVSVPAAVTAGHEERPPPPREWLERWYADLRDYRVLERGGHFWAAEVPEVFARRLREFLAEHAQL